MEGKKTPKKGSVSFSLPDGSVVASVLHDTVAVAKRDVIMMDWEEKFDKKRQKKYYKNKKTGILQWKNPVAEIRRDEKKQIESKAMESKVMEEDKTAKATSINTESIKEKDNEKRQTSTSKGTRHRKKNWMDREI